MGYVTHDRFKKLNLFFRIITNLKFMDQFYYLILYLGIEFFYLIVGLLIAMDGSSGKAWSEIFLKSWF